MTIQEIIDIYISFFEKRGHKKIPNSSLVPIDDPTTLFTSSGMQPLVPYLLGEAHPAGVRLVNVQNCFRAVDIDEVGDNRHTTFFRMLGNWSLGDYFKSEEIPWLWEFLTEELELPKEKLYITVFSGDGSVEFDSESEEIWQEVLAKSFGSSQENRIFKGGVSKNWWSRSGTPENMPAGEPGGPDTEVYFKFDNIEHNSKCGRRTGRQLGEVSDSERESFSEPGGSPNRRSGPEGDDPTKCECGKFLEIANSVFMQYIKTQTGSFVNLPKQNVDFGAGAERLLAAVENKNDIFTTSLFAPIIETVEKATGKKYGSANSPQTTKQMRIIADHLRAAVYLLDAKVLPSNKERGYVLRRLIRRSVDNLGSVEASALEKIIEAIVTECGKTDESLKTNFEFIKNSVLEEAENYKRVLDSGKKLIERELNILGIKKGDEIKGELLEIPASVAFKGTATIGIGPTQFENLGYTFDKQEYAALMEKHKNLSKSTSSGMFKGGLADKNELTIKGHTATHLLHQALRDVFGNQLHQTGSNITSERVRFDFNHDKLLTEDEIKKVEEIVNGKIKENLPVHFEMMPLNKAKDIGAIGLFDEKYQADVKVYFIGGNKSPSADASGLPRKYNAYSVELCGGPHVNFTSEIKSFKIVKQENLGKLTKRIYAKVE
ncbi:MAG: alanine--tRNA ligase [Candidatus Levybacteria bacterium CG10_big_fil_rev_8_21_14_0_10_35_13]|nr:MAG: alanine--tRNA ligase [Candidatus Levybacteria bacterium CG10_big_fil_rev_8_21_14_0_10_35_13]